MKVTYVWSYLKKIQGHDHGSQGDFCVKITIYKLILQEIGTSTIRAYLLWPGLLKAFWDDCRENYTPPIPPSVEFWVSSERRVSLYGHSTDTQRSLDTRWDWWCIENDERLTQNYHKFSNEGATPIRAPPFDPKPSEVLDVFGHISAKNGPIFIL